MKFLSITLATIAVLAVASCSPTGSLSEEKEGTVSIKLNLAQDGGKAFTSATAQAKADVYDVFASNGSAIYGKNVSVGSTSWTLPVGSYKIVALAGKKQADNDAYVIATADASDIAVVAGGVTPVTLTLRSITYSITTPSSVNVTTATSYSIGVALDTKSAFVQPTGLYLKIAGEGYAGTASKDLYSPTISGTVKTYSATLTSPTEASTPTITLGEPSLQVFGSTIWSADIVGKPRAWDFPSTATFTELEQDMTAKLNFVSSANTGLSIALGWGA